VGPRPPVTARYVRSSHQAPVVSIAKIRAGPWSIERVPSSLRHAIRLAREHGPAQVESARACIPRRGPSASTARRAEGARSNRARFDDFAAEPLNDTDTSIGRFRTRNGRLRGLHSGHGICQLRPAPQSAAAKKLINDVRCHTADSLLAALTVVHDGADKWP